MRDLPKLVSLLYMKGVGRQALTWLILLGLGACADATGVPVSVQEAPPGVDEPVYDPATYTSLFYDDMSTYGSLTDMSSGVGAHRWESTVGNAPGDPWTEQKFYVGGGRNGTNAVASVYRQHPDTTNSGWNPGELHPLVDVTAGQNPDVVILTQWIKNTTPSPFRGKLGLRKQTADWNHRHVIGVGSSPPQPAAIIACYWESGWPHDPLDPVNTPWYAPGGAHRFTLVYDAGGASPHGYYSNAGWAQYALWAGVQNQQGLPNDGQYHRYTIQLTKAPASGQGRVEMWADGVKINEWIGDDPTRPEFGMVYTALKNSSERLLPNWFFFSEHKNSLISAEFEVWLDEARVFTPQ